MISPEQARNVAAHWLDCWNRHDLEGILRHYADEVELISPVVTHLLDDPFGTIRGKAALRSFFEKGLATYPNLHFELIRILPGLESVTVCYRGINNQLAAEVMELDAQGKIHRALAHYALEA
jgi:hypothetical protein